MVELSKKYNQVIAILLEKSTLSSSQLHEILQKAGERVSLVTVKRIVSGLARKNLLKVVGSGRSTVYGVAAAGRVFFDLDARAYYAIEPDKRFGMNKYR